MADPQFKARRKPITGDMKIRISQQLQLRMLEEIGRIVSTSGLENGLVFHGGTSLSIIHGSPRWSEDLDFMSTPEAAKSIFKNRNRIEAALQFRASLDMPGADVRVTDRTMREETRYGDVDRLLIRWEHPEVIGAVKIKVELYICPPERLAQYKAVPSRVSADGLVSRTRVNAAVPVSIWADKVVAMAQRPALKHRDMHDLGYLRPLLHDGSDRQSALGASMGIYDRSAGEIQAGLARDLVRAGDNDLEGFRENMARWFTEDRMIAMEQDGRLQQLFDDYLEEIALGRAIVDDMAGCQPEAEGVEPCGGM